MARKKLTIPTFHWQPPANGKPGQLQREANDTQKEMSYSDVAATGQHRGMPVCKTAFNSMIAEFGRRRREGDPFDIAYVTFSKSSLFRIIAQEQTDQVRLYFAFPEPQHLSLAVEGRTKDDQPLNAEEIRRGKIEELYADDPVDPYYEEKGNGGKDEKSNFDDRGNNVRLLSVTYDKLVSAGELKFLKEDGDQEEKIKRLGVLLLKAINNL